MSKQEVPVTGTHKGVLGIKTGLYGWTWELSRCAAGAWATGINAPWASWLICVKQSVA